MTTPAPEGDSRAGLLARGRHQYRFVILLASLILLVFSVPFVHLVGGQNHPRLISILYTTAFLAMVLSAVFATSRSRRMRIIMSFVLVPEFALHVLHGTLDQTALAVTKELLDIAVVTYAILVIFIGLFSDRRVTIDTIAASLCVYFLFAVWWASTFTLLEIVVPGSFSFGQQVEETQRLTAVSSDAMYFSFVTISTLGYGDLLPHTGPARMIAALEAVVGQLYIAVLVARLVGMHIAEVTANRLREQG